MHLHGLGGDAVALLGGQRREQVHERERVVQVAQRIHKGGVPGGQALDLHLDLGRLELSAQATAG